MYFVYCEVEGGVLSHHCVSQKRVADDVAAADVAAAAVANDADALSKMLAWLCDGYWMLLGKLGCSHLDGYSHCSSMASCS